MQSLKWYSFASAKYWARVQLAEHMDVKAEAYLKMTGIPRQGGECCAYRRSSWTLWLYHISASKSKCQIRARIEESQNSSTDKSRCWMCYKKKNRKIKTRVVLADSSVSRNMKNVDSSTRSLWWRAACLALQLWRLGNLTGQFPPEGQVAKGRTAGIYV